MKSPNKWLKRGTTITGAIGVIWLAIYFWPVPTQEKREYFNSNRPLVMAHQGGKALAPESTMEAFEKAAHLDVDVIDFDVHLTKDGNLMAIHDPTVDRTTDGTGKVKDMTAKEIQQLDAGAHFQAVDGSYPYQGKGVSIPTVGEVFDAFPDMKWNIEIKDTNEPDQYKAAAVKLWELITEYELEEKVVIASFDQEIIEMVLNVSNGNALTAGGKSEVAQFVVLHKLFLNGAYRTDIDAIEIPIEQYGINLVDRKLIDGAHEQGIDVHYWTINEEKTMHALLDAGADGILTDRPDVLLDVLYERGGE